MPGIPGLQFSAEGVCEAVCSPQTSPPWDPAGLLQQHSAGDIVTIQAQ